MVASELVIIFGKSFICSRVNFSLNLRLVSLINHSLSRGENRRFNKHKVRIISQTTQQPNERLLKLVVRLSTDIVVLQVLLSVEGNLLGLNFSVFHVDFVTDQHDGNVLTHTGQIFVPLGHVRVGDAGADIEHDDAAVATDVVAVAETTEFFLTCGVPHVELDLTVISEEGHGVDFYTEGCDVLLFEFTG